MPKIIELTFELNLNKVSCPGVWLCQDGMVSLSVFALGSRYETCLVPPIFPLLFREVFYFRRRFQESCTLSNIFCLLKDETIYCELIQWSNLCGKDKCTVLAQYLGALNDILFPSNYCSMDGVDLLMRRSKKFPGILAPKIEVSTKVRIDEIFEQPNNLPPRPPSPSPCACISKPDMEPGRQKSVCHTPMYHRYRCVKHLHDSRNSRSYLDIPSKESIDCCDKFADQSEITKHSDPEPQKLMLKSRFVLDTDNTSDHLIEGNKYKREVMKYTPCACDVCRRYHELFHAHPLLNTTRDGAYCGTEASKSYDREPFYNKSMQTRRLSDREKQI